MNDPKEEIRKLMARVRKGGRLPSSAVVVTETFERLGYVDGSVAPDSVPRDFNVMLRRLWEETLKTLEWYEDHSYREGIPREFIRAYPNDVTAAEQVAQREGFNAGISYLLSSWYPRLRGAFLSVNQGRKARGGKDFELQIEGLFKLARVPFDKQELHEHTDFILPKIQVFRENRTIAAVVSAKRTLRERWAEVAEELFNLRSPNVFLFTADEAVSKRHVEVICGRYNIYLVVWDAEKTQKFPDEPLVLGYTQWAIERLPMLRQHWP